MAVAGSNARTDFHYNEGTEYFYQLEGRIDLFTHENGEVVKNELKAGDMFLLSPRVPHSPVRHEGSLGLVIETKRKPGQKDGLMWFCSQCHHKLYEEYFELKSIERDFLPVFARFNQSEAHRTCAVCGVIAPADPRYL